MVSTTCATTSAANNARSNSGPASPVNGVGGNGLGHVFQHQAQGALEAFPLPVLDVVGGIPYIDTAISEIVDFLSMVDDLIDEVTSDPEVFGTSMVVIFSPALARRTMIFFPPRVSRSKAWSG